jgi:hypothetical protein
LITKEVKMPVVAWNTIAVQTIQLYPSKKPCTAMSLPSFHHTPTKRAGKSE